MADNDELFDLEGLDADIQARNRVAERITSLTDTAKRLGEEREAEAQARAQAEAERDAMAKEKDFYASFADSTSKYPGASEHMDAIKERVMKGYTVEDATVSVLASEGKLGAQSQEAPRRENPAGGSAVNQPNTQGAKTTADMTQEERREALLGAEKAGEISV